MNLNFQDLKCRFAVRKDIDVIYQLLKDIVFEANLSHRFSQTKDSLYQALFSDQSFAEVMIAETNESIVGICLFSLTNHNFYLFDSQGLFIHNLCVNKDYRRLGIATRIMQEIRKIAKDRKCDRIEGVVLKDNEKAIKLCQHLGDIQPVDYIHYVREKLTV